MPLLFMVPVITPAIAAPDRRWLSIDPSTPFERVPTTEHPLGRGAVRLRVPGRDGPVELDAAPAAVITLVDGASVPEALAEHGVALGRSERSWRVAVQPADSRDAYDLAMEWAAHPAVSSALPDLRYRHRPTVEFDDPDLGAQWYLEVLGFDAMSERSLGDAAVRVAVIDGGIDIGHPDLAGSVDSPWDVLDGDDDPTPPLGEGCEDGVMDLCDDHGTSSAGIVAARSNNAVGIVGLCSECTLIPIRLLGEGSGLSEDVAAFEHAIDADAWVINNSWGFVEPIAVPAPLADVIARALTEPRDGKGAVVVFAAGNEDRELDTTEITALPGVLTVSATDENGVATDYTNRGDPIDIAAPSATVTLAAGGGLNTTYGGTSAAAPVATGVAAWTLSYRPELSGAEVTELLIATARPVVEPGEHDIVFGYGHLDPETLIDTLEGGPEPTPEDSPRACASRAARTPSCLLTLFPLIMLLRRRK